ncbi:T9SS type A sorting domain-containing protein [Larkinella punicea]|uniref:T9SS C-terminal target domain-containing protein n=1 Tax=Larkinella punicea TaxID=2315727 RepID=A0A368JII3_9BACT|nr:T9SS type A sorting domain-containing protein [Larkinella punicea]RCR66856.1 T9SS C-terminal target domain-containing protein [Larkinella punicea]
MKAINPILFGLACLFSVSAVAQKMVPHSFRHQADTSDRDASDRNQLRFLTQVAQPNTTFLRLYFTGTQLGEGSYLVLEGTDGARQKLRKQDLENWHYSSAYFNGHSVNVSLFAAAGDRNTVIVSGLKRSGESTRPTNKARPAARLSAADVSPVTYPYANAVGRFTNGSESYGTGWIAPNGAIVTSPTIAYRVNSEGYDVIEFNVPASAGTTVQHPAPQDQFPVEDRNKNGYQATAFKGASAFLNVGWAVLDALPNETGLRPGERQQEYFRVATNPSNYTIDAMGDVPVDLFHYGSIDSDHLAGNTTYRTLRLTQTALLKQNDHLGKPNGGGADRDLFVLYNMALFIESHEGAPVTYEGSNVAVGVHNNIPTIDPHPAYGLGFRDDGFRNGLARFFADKSAYVDLEGLYDQPTGEIHKPYLTGQQVAQHAPNDYTVYFARGTYPGVVTFNRPMTLRAPVGKVVIGSSNGGARKAAESSVARNVAMIEASGAHSRLESPETAEKVRVYPNPFREQTEIKYPFAEGGLVSVRIVNTAGVPVATFTPNNAASGQNGVQWDGTDQNGMSVPAGLYIVKVNYGNQTFTTKVLKK